MQTDSSRKVTWYFIHKKKLKIFLIKNYIVNSQKILYMPNNQQFFDNKKEYYAKDLLFRVPLLILFFPISFCFSLNIWKFTVYFDMDKNKVLTKLDDLNFKDISENNVVVWSFTLFHL